MNWFPPVFFALHALAAVFNLVLGAVILYLRLQADRDNYTKGQLWGLTLLAFLFLMNTVIIGASLLELHAIEVLDIGLVYDSLGVIQTADVLSSILLLAFGLSYPRPVVKWERLERLMVALLCVGLVCTLALMADHFEASVGKGVLFRPVEILYLFAIYIPVFIWLGEYSRSVSTEMRTVFTLLIWGFLFGPMTDKLSNLLSYNIMAVTFVHMSLIMLVLARLAMALRAHRDRWGPPETIHLGILAASVVICVAWRVFRPPPGDPDAPMSDALAVGSFITSSLGWMLLRPALFSYGLLRYRFIGRETRADTAFTIMGTALISATAGVAVVLAMGGGTGAGTAAAGIVASLVALYPGFLASRVVLARILPVTVGTESMSLKERRDIYLMALQTAVVGGKVPDGFDRETLGNLRGQLGVSEREHDLLLESIAMHEERAVRAGVVEEAYLITRSGKLVAHHLPEDVPEGSDALTTAAMLMAINDFVTESIKKGEEEKVSLDTINYGSRSLLIEKEGGLVLAVLVEGEDEPSLRHAMREVFEEIMEAHGTVLNDEWDGNTGAISGIEELFTQLITGMSEAEDGA